METAKKVCTKAGAQMGHIHMLASIAMAIVNINRIDVIDSLFEAEIQ